uniref:Uncharacterized protein n=1 Tax=Rhizophora mucronata TaxID=61149 RepID=A0A2P2N9Q4_RHIMU
MYTLTNPQCRSHNQGLSYGQFAFTAKRCDMGQLTAIQH